MLAAVFFYRIYEEKVLAVLFSSQLFFLCEEEPSLFEEELYLVMQAEKHVEFLGWVFHSHPFLRISFFFLFKDIQCHSYEKYMFQFMSLAKCCQLATRRRLVPR